MRENVKSDIELVTQVVIAIAIVITAGVLVKRTVFSGQVSGRLASINAGERLTIPNVDWAQNKKSLVFFLKKDCTYCTSSAEFYQQLVEDANKRKVKCLAVFPNTPEEAHKYLKYIELPIENVYTGSMSDFKISGTPTVVFVDQNGVAKSVWIGAQSQNQQEMRDKLIALFDS